MTYEMERMRPVSRRVHLMFLNANTAGNDRLWKLLGGMLGAFNWSLHPFTPTHTQHMGTFNFSCNVDNLNQDIVSFSFCTGSSSALIPPPPSVLLFFYCSKYFMWDYWKYLGRFVFFFLRLNGFAQLFSFSFSTLLYYGQCLSVCYKMIPFYYVSIVILL